MGEGESSMTVEGEMVRLSVQCTTRSIDLLFGSRGWGLFDVLCMHMYVLVLRL